MPGNSVATIRGTEVHRDGNVKLEEARERHIMSGPFHDAHLHAMNRFRFTLSVIWKLREVHAARKTLNETETAPMLSNGGNAVGTTWTGRRHARRCVEGLPRGEQLRLPEGQAMNLCLREDKGTHEVTIPRLANAALAQESSQLGKRQACTAAETDVVHGGPRTNCTDVDHMKDARGETDGRHDQEVDCSAEHGPSGMVGTWNGGSSGTETNDQVRERTRSWLWRRVRLVSFELGERPGASSRTPVTKPDRRTRTLQQR